MTTNVYNKHIFYVFYVVDRPASLSILKPIIDLNLPMGLITHPFTSENFKKLFKSISNNYIVKMCDCGAFQRKKRKMEYLELFQIYEALGVQYGLIIDYLNDKNKTIESAEFAISLYEENSWSFHLVGVCQGRDINEYIECLDELKAMGYKYIAIGGLLKKIHNTARYTRIKNENFLWSVVQAIRKKWNGWLYVLGAYNPKRHIKFVRYKIFGADWKGWIFKYNNTLNREEEIRKWLIKNIFDKFYGHLNSSIEQILRTE